MAKIIIITPTNPLDRYGHSGVVYSITNQLKKNNEIIWLQPRISFIGILVNLFPLILVYILKVIGYTISHHTAISKMYAVYLNKKLKKTDYDYIFGFESIYLAYIKSKKPIFYRSDALYHSMVDYYIFNIPKYMVNQGDEVERRTLQNVENMFCPSQWVIDEINKYYPEIDINKIILVHSGANITREIDIQHKKKETQTLNLLFIGSDPKRKGIDIAIETTHILNEVYNRQTILTVIGGPIDSNSVYVSYIGFINKNIEKQSLLFEKILSETDLLIFPTKAECAGIINCEAAAYGIPVIAYKTGGVPSYVLDDVNGCLLDVTDSARDFAKLINGLTKDKLQIYSRNARALFEKSFNWNVWGETVNAIINKKEFKQ